jgi:hypothetical protein
MSVEAVRIRAREWMIAKGLAKPGEPTSTVMRRLAEYRAALPKMPKPADKQWARNIVARYQAGESIQPYNVRLAHEALGLVEVPVLRQSGTPVQRPDVQDLRAGDVMEPAF